METIEFKGDGISQCLKCKKIEEVNNKLLCFDCFNEKKTKEIDKRYLLSNGMEKNQLWFLKQIKGLIYIIKSDKANKGFIHRDYIKEKLNMILSVSGINFHPSILDLILPDDEIEEIIKSQNLNRKDFEINEGLK